jgi:hypothetical protein
MKSMASAKSVNTGRATDELEAVATGPLLAEQVEVIEWAASQGLAVPDRPRVAVVAADTAGDRSASLDVCLWLPSTEFVSRATGIPVDAAVPDAWRPARATLARHNDRWQVARLADADERSSINCGGLT